MRRNNELTQIIQEVQANPEGYLDKKNKANQSNAALFALQSFAGGAATTQPTGVFGQPPASNVVPGFGAAPAFGNTAVSVNKHRSLHLVSKHHSL